MPIGCCSCVPYVTRLLRRHNARSVLDLGIGMGFYGAVVRQWWDRGVQPWHTRLVGVEGWESYRNPCWGLYDLVVVREIEDYLTDASETFDVILLLDVLEHFIRSAGERVLRACSARINPSGVLIVATPAVWMDQGPAHGNDLETHRSLWTVSELAAIGFSIAWDGSLDHFGHRMVFASRSS